LKGEIMRNVYSLDKGWKFHDTIIDLPHTWNLEDGTIRKRECYQRELDILEEHREDKLFLEFLGANAVCQVYLNKTFIGEHRGGYSTFRFDITQYYQWEGSNLLQVYVDNRITEDVSPLNGDFTIYGGLYRSVNLICTPHTHFNLLYWGSQGVILRPELDLDSNGIVKIEVFSICKKEALVNLSIKDANQMVICTANVSADQKSITMNVEKPVLWNGKTNPYLYTLEACLQDETEIFDEVTLSFGFRDISLTSNSGFFLNHERFKINGVAKHQDFEEVGNATERKHIETDFRLIGEIGANSVRLSHYQHNSVTYDICDQEGYLVWAEIPMLVLPDSELVLKNADDQLKELLFQNCHHPSICFWGIQNEIAMGGETMPMYRSVQMLNDRVHELFPTAITASANMYYVKNNSPLNKITDIQGYNLYYGWYYGEIKDLNTKIDEFHKENPNVALGISEYGVDCNLSFHSDNPKVKDYTEEYQSLYHEQTYEIIKSKPFMWGSYVWNMFDFGSSIRDEGGFKGKNCKGLVTFDRKIKKDSFYYYKAQWSDEKFIHICEKRFRYRHKQKVDIKVYSNLDTLSLLRGDETLYLNRKGEKVFIFHDIELVKGENCIRVLGENLSDEIVIDKVDAANESYVFIDPNPEINVKNWFTQKKGEMDLFPKNKYSILDKLGELMENEEAWSIVKDMLPQIAERTEPGSGVTLLWVANKMKRIITEEHLKEVNEKLSLIAKKKL
jgi:beta-galactosidase